MPWISLCKDCSFFWGGWGVEFHVSITKLWLFDGNAGMPAKIRVYFSENFLAPSETDKDNFWFLLHLWTSLPFCLWASLDHWIVLPRQCFRHYRAEVAQSVTPLRFPVKLYYFFVNFTKVWQNWHFATKTAHTSICKASSGTCKASSGMRSLR